MFYFFFFVCVTNQQYLSCTCKRVTIYTWICYMLLFSLFEWGECMTAILFYKEDCKATEADGSNPVILAHNTYHVALGLQVIY